MLTILEQKFLEMVPAKLQSISVLVRTNGDEMSEQLRRLNANIEKLIEVINRK